MSAAHPLRTASRPRRDPSRGQCGFTLIELIMVIVVMGVLAVVAAPRIFNSNDFYARGFHDETLGLLRFAQKTAIAQRRVVCVTLTLGGASLRIASLPGVYTCDTDLRGPRGDSPATITAKSGVTYVALPGSFNFDGLGQPIVNSTGVPTNTFVFQVNNAVNTITVEAATGYVHE